MKASFITLVLSSFFASSLFAADPVFPSCSVIVDRLRNEYWITRVKQIPATVIDKGIMRDVPYLSYKSGDYELNVYGDPQNPAAVELGVYGGSLTNEVAKRWCIGFIGGLLRSQSQAQRDAWEHLHYDKDIFTNGEITFEITPPTDEDAYGGWWVSAYSVKALDCARATPKEIADITVIKNVSVLQTNTSGWSESDMKLARPTKTANDDGMSITIAGVKYKNARIMKRNPAEVTVYHSTGVATIPIEELSVSMQVELGYDPSAAAVFRDDRAKTQAVQQAVEVARQQAQQTAQSQSSGADSSSLPIPSGSQSYDQGRVYVSGYYRKNGTYVHSYTRRR
jgi:hypothetical protein